MKPLSCKEFTFRVDGSQRQDVWRQPGGAERTSASRAVFTEGLPVWTSGQDAPLFLSFHIPHDPVSWGAGVHERGLAGM